MKRLAGVDGPTDPGAAAVLAEIRDRWRQLRALPDSDARWASTTPSTPRYHALIAEIGVLAAEFRALTEDQGQERLSKAS